MWNSFAAATVQTVLILVTASMGAYALARLDFPGKKVVFGAIIATLLVPPVVFLIPNYLIVQNLGWLDTILAITVPGAAGAFGIFFLRQFFLGLPPEIEEAARIDGAGDIRIFLQIVIPLARPALATLAVLSFLGNWNDFLWPVYVLLSPENLTLQPGLNQLQGAYSTHFAIVMAGAVIASVPVLILFGSPNDRSWSPWRGPRSRDDPLDGEGRRRRHSRGIRGRHDGRVRPAAGAGVRTDACRVSHRPGFRRPGPSSRRMARMSRSPRTPAGSTCSSRHPTIS